MTEKIIVTGAAGLVGQNLILCLREKGYRHIVALDKHPANLAILKKLNPDINACCVDLSVLGAWEKLFENASSVVIAHAQITGLNHEDFYQNNLLATQHIITAIKRYRIPYSVHISSSVINSVAKDFYSMTKTQQEEIILASNIPCCVLRPTLMFGWFDPKHLGWLSRFMEKTPIFPIPGNGLYLRQPLYVRDFCQMICAALGKKPIGQVYDIVGQEQINYIDLIKLIKKVKELKTWITPIPYGLFYFLLKCYAVIHPRPPFTCDQLTALTAGDYFTGILAEEIFGISMTALNTAILETFTHPVYSKITLER